MSLGRHVALKVLPLHAARGGSGLERFRREAQAAARLHHTNIVPVFEVGQDGDVYFYAMQFIAGQPLDQVLDEVRKPPRRRAARPTRSPHRRQRRPLAADRPVRRDRRRSGSAGRADVPVGARCRATAVCRPVRALGPTRALLSQRRPRRRAGGRGPRLRPQARASSTATSSRRTCCSTPTAGLGHRLRPGQDRRPTPDADRRHRRHACATWPRSASTAGPTRAATSTPGPDAVRDAGAAAGLRRVGADEAHAAGSPRGAAGPAQARRRRLPRDLETIVAKATDREPARRYQTAADLGADLRRFLDDRPIHARRIGPGERAWRWGKRNPALAAATALTFAALLVATVVSALFAAAQADSAAKQKALSDELKETLRRVAASSQRSATGPSRRHAVTPPTPPCIAPNR